MAALEASLSLLSLYPPSSPKFLFTQKPIHSIKLHISTSTPILSHIFAPSRLPLLSTNPTRKLSFELCSAVQEVEVEAEPNQTQEANLKRKLYVVNLPWSLSVVDIKNLFGECGTVKDVEIIKNKGGRSRGFAFVTMASGEEAQAVIDKFDSYELSGRIIRVQFAKRFKKPSPPPPPPTPPSGETRHKIYVSNLEWKVRSSHLREIFSANFNPVSARVVFDSPSGRSSGYGFVSFATKEEAEAAISALDGKELLGRPLRLKFSQKNINEAANETEKESISEEQLEKEGISEEKPEES